MPDHLKDGTEAAFAYLTYDLVFESRVLFLDMTGLPDNTLELREGA